MVALNTANSIWQQLSNACFLLSGCFAEQLVIRMFLSMAYILILLNGCLGWPLWPDVINKGRLSVDAIVWSCLNLWAHGSAFCRLFMDEGPVELTDDQSALWRLFYRHSGLSKLLFKTELVDHFELVEIKQAGSPIATEEYFYIVLDGAVRIDAHVGEKVVSMTLGSGRMFDIKHLHLFPKKSIFSDEKLVAKSLTENGRLFRCSPTDLVKISQNPLAKPAWMALLISTLAEMAEHPYKKKSDEASVGQERDPIFRPLEAWEEPKPVLAGSEKAYKMPLRHIFHSMKTHFLPPWPVVAWEHGLRHGGLPAPPVNPPEEQDEKLKHDQTYAEDIA